jgi:hypothetical protein
MLAPMSLKSPLAGTLLALSMLSAGGSARAAATAPDEGWVVWASNRQEGRHEIYLMKATATEPLRLTHQGGTYPAWSPDGNWIAYWSAPDQTTHVVRPDASEDHEVCKGAFVFWMHDGTGLVCAVLRTDWVGFEGMSRSEQYLLANPYLGTSTELFKRSDFKHLTDNYGSAGERHFIPGGITHDGRYMVGWVFSLFDPAYTADNGTFTSVHSSVVLDLQDKSKIYYLGPGCTTTTPPSGDLVYHVSRDGPTAPDIYSMNVHDLATRSSYQKVAGRADDDWGHDYFPRISNDNQWLTYGASVACHPWYECDYEIFLHRLGADPTESIRLTTNPANDNYPHMFVGQPWTPALNGRLVLAPNRLALAGSSDLPPAARRVVMISAGGKPLTGFRTEITYGSGSGWLTVSTADAGKYTELVVETNPAELPTGKYTATVEIWAAESPTSQKLPVQLDFARSRDGGAEDAGGPDAGAAEVDAAPEAGASTDAPAATSSSGCSCGLAGSARPGLLWLLPALGLLVRRRTSRARSPARGSRTRCTTLPK